MVFKIIVEVTLGDQEKLMAFVESNSGLDLVLTVLELG